MLRSAFDPLRLALRLPISLLRVSLPAFSLLAFSLLVGDGRAQRSIKTTTLGDQLACLAPTARALGRHVEQQQDADRDIESAGWMMLGFASNGSNLRTGPDRIAIRHLIRFLRKRQDDQGVFRVAPRRSERQRVAHLVATLAMARLRLDSDYKLLNKNVRRGVAAILGPLTAANTPALSAEETAVTAMLAVTLQAMQSPDSKAILQRAIRGVQGWPLGKDRLHDAVRHYVSIASGASHPADYTIAMCWPAAPDKEPLQAWIAAFAAREMPPPVRETQHRIARRLLPKRGSDGLWPAAPGLGRLTTSAMLAGVLGMTGTAAPAPVTVRAAGPKQAGNPWDQPIK